MGDLAMPLVAAGLSALAVGVVRWDAVRRGLLDRPNARSSHDVPTPRGGGLGLLIGVALALLLLAGPPRDAAGWAIVLATGIVAAVGWVDDHGGAPVRLRLAVHVAAGLLLLPLADATLRAIAGEEAGSALRLVFAAWCVFWTVSAVNVVNFVDGIDGMIGAQVVVLGGHFALLGAPGGPAATLGLALAGASAGFLLWNRPPARIFLGDVGSGALGVLAVAGGALVLREARTGMVAAFAPLAPIFLDATVTLLRRWRRGERLSEAHRSHLYQRLVRAGLGHGRVTLAYAGAALGCSAVAVRLRHDDALVLPVLLAALLLLGWLAERRAEPFARG